MEQETRIETIHFTDIAAKSPAVSPIDLYAFGLLKLALSKR